MRSADERLLPFLRDDLQLLPGPPAENGAPSWSIHDRVRNTFFRLGWLEFELLVRWSTAKNGQVTAAQLADRVNRETTIATGEDEVQSLEWFLLANSLLAPGDPQVSALLQEKMTKKKKIAVWLLHNYLFVRVPLVRPDRFLDMTLPVVRFLVSKVFLHLLVLGACLGIFLVMRQWTTFIHTFSGFFTAEGVLLYSITLVFVKVFHELGHAYTAKSYGVKVPSMGVAFLVLWPILYSDTTESWKLTKRKQRMAIVAAGSLSELLLAVVATLLWSFLPDSPLRSACFVLATVSWVTSVLWNLNPLMRFDGYFFLSDYLDIPNLQDRSFALAKHHLRKFLLGMELELPEDFGSERNALLIAYAYVVWIYRIFLFTAIALTVYYLFFKVLGIFLFAVEICWFIAMPVLKEMKIWWQLRSSIGSCRTVIVSLLVVSSLIALLIVPWQTNVEGPAVLKASDFKRLYPPFSAQIAEVLVSEGQQVEEGDVLFRLTSSELDFREKQTMALWQDLQEKLQHQITGDDLFESRKVIESRLAEAQAELSGYRNEKKRLQITAGSDGVILDMANGLRVGLWVDSSQKLGVLVGHSQVIIEAYINENFLQTIKKGTSALFFAENDGEPLQCHVEEIDQTVTSFLKEPYLASVYGGDIGVQISAEKRLRPRKSWYRLILVPDEQLVAEQVIRGKVVLKGRERSIVAEVWRRVVAVFIRESGF